MAGFSLNIDGMSAVLSNLDAFSASMKAQVQAKIEEHTQGTYDDSQAVVPVLSGELKDSGEVAIGELQGTVTYTSDHSLWVEIGHHTRSGSWVPAQPYLVPAFQQHAQQLKADCEQIASGG